jgi:predicted ABC-type transport system involved in lysophospholipase L1 biosynthesis ATPase subunit
MGVKDTISQSQPVIEAKGVNLVFQTADGPVQALKDVNLTIGKGDFVSFIGPSGLREDHLPAGDRRAWSTPTSAR